MKTITLGLILTAFATLAKANVVVELIPNEPGPYVGGESITVDVWLQPSDTLYIRGVRLDFTDSSEELNLSDQFEFDYAATPGGPGPWFAFTDLELPRPHTYMTLDCWCRPYWMLLQHDVPTHIGSVDVQLPNELGQFRLDVLNSDAQEQGFGAFIRAASGLDQYLFAHEGEITGGTLDFTIVPELSSLWLFATCVSIQLLRRSKGL